MIEGKSNSEMRKC